jgi:hypothetical protein
MTDETTGNLEVLQGKYNDMKEMNEEEDRAMRQKHDYQKQVTKKEFLRKKEIDQEKFLALMKAREDQLITAQEQQLELR